MTTPNRHRPLRGRALRRRDERGLAAPELVVIMPLVMLIFLTLVQWSVQLYNDRICRKDAHGNPDYTDDSVFPVLWSASGRDAS